MVDHVLVWTQATDIQLIYLAAWVLLSSQGIVLVGTSTATTCSRAQRPTTNSTDPAGRRDSQNSSRCHGLLQAQVWFGHLAIWSTLGRRMTSPIQEREKPLSQRCTCCRTHETTSGRIRQGGWLATEPTAKSSFFGSSAGKDTRPLYRELMPLVRVLRRWMTASDPFRDPFRGPAHFPCAALQRSSLTKGPSRQALET